MSKSTPEELARRRAERMANPIYRELVNRAKRIYWRRVKDQVNARKRAEYAARTPEQVAEDRARRRVRESAPKYRDNKNARNSEYYARNRDRIRERQKAYYIRKMSTDPSFAERVKRNNERYAERCKTDRNLKAARAAATKKWKESEKGLEAKARYRLAMWVKIADGGVERIKMFMKHTTPEHRHDFSVWYSRTYLINRTKGLGHITPEEGAEQGL